MAEKLVYQPPKWEKELKKDLQLFRQSKGKDITLSNLQKILKEEEEFPSMRNYGDLYANLQLKYRILAGSSYLRDNSNVQVIQYTYLSGMASIFAYLFCIADPHSKRNITEQINMILDFAYGLLQLFAVQGVLPQCLAYMDHPYVQLLLGNFEKAVELLASVNSAYDAANPQTILMSDMEVSAIRAVADKDEKALARLLTQHVKKYRKQPVGYSTFVDAYSIAYIKLMQQHGMNCSLDIIEIPTMFFDEVICKIDPTEVSLPFYEDAVEQLKKTGIEWH